MTEYYLRPWTQSEVYGGEILVLKCKANGYQIRPINRHKATTRGVYIQYPEGIFGVFVDDTENLCMLIKDAVLPLSDVKAITLHIRLSRRELKFHLRDNRIVRYQYLSIWRLLYKPEILLDMIFVDMWELNFELPSWVEGCYQKGDAGITFMKNVCFGDKGETLVQ